MANRPLAVLAVLLVAGAAVALLVLDPFASDGADIDRTPETGAAPAPAGVDAPSPAAVPDERAPTLSMPDFDRRGPGAVRVRLLVLPERTPLADQPVRLVRETGERLERTTGPDGVVLFPDVPAGRGMRLEVEATSHPPVTVKGVDVLAGQTTSLEDLLLGRRVVLRGRVVDEQGKAIAGAAVAAYSSGGIDLSQGVVSAMVTEALRFPTPADEAKSDDDGRFELASLSPGRYRLTARRSGFAMNHQADLFVAPDRATGAVTIVLGPPARVSGRVTDDRGAGVEGAAVIAIEAGEMRGPRADVTTRKDVARTGADGRYVLDTLNLGVAYRFGVVAPGWAPVFETQATTLEAAQERDFALARGGALEGRVVDAGTEAPVEGARVTVVVGQMGAFMGGGRRAGGATGGGGAPVADTTTSTGAATTGADGRFRVEGLRPGPVMAAQVRAQGFAPFSASAFTGNPWGDVVANESLAVEARLVAGGTVMGRITSALDGGPVPGAQVLAVSQVGFWQGYPTAVADGSGAYRLEGVAPGSRFAVVATAPGFATPDASDEGSQLSMPAEGGTLTRDLALSAAGAVEGVVTTSRGAPVAGVRVRTRPVDRGGGFAGMGGRGAWRALLPRAGAVVLTDAEGRYRVDDVSADGKLVVEASSDDVVTTESEPFEVRAGAVARVDLSLLGPATLRGRVVDEGGRPVAGARVRAGFLDAGAAGQRNLAGFRADALLDPRATALSDADGRFEIGRLRPGLALLKVERAGFVTFYRRDLLLQPDAASEGYVATLSRGETIAGVVKGEDGRALPNARVFVTRQAGRGPGAPATPGPAAATPATASTAPTGSEGAVEPTLGGVTDERGRFEVENVPPGEPWQVVVGMAPGHRAWWGGSDEAAIRRGVAAGDRNVEFVLKRAAPGDLGMGAGGPPRPATPPGTPAMGPGAAGAPGAAMGG